MAPPQEDTQQPNNGHQFSEPTPYLSLVSALNNCSNDLQSPLLIEILLASHPLPPGIHVSVEQNEIFIPKSTILKAFITAREIFFSFDLVSIQTHNHQAILDSSAIILLFDPEHITAANARKRILLSHGIGKLGLRMAEMELWFMEGMLTSTMKRHNKSPTLWGHRRWILDRINNASTTREITVVALKSAENHPKNYYAWDFVRWWVAKHPEVLKTFGTDEERKTSIDEVGMSRIIGFYLDWALRHPSDTSGWSFLLWLLDFVTTTIDIQDPYGLVAKSILSRVAGWRLKNESLWVFLRTLMAKENIPAEVLKNYDLQKGITQDSRERTPL